MFRFIFSMIIPVMVFAYTLSFARWLGEQRQARRGPVYLLGAGSLGLSGYVFWRMMM